MPTPRNILITGANRGIGLELVKTFLNLIEKPEVIFATFRKPENAKELLDLATQNNVVRPLVLDVQDFASFPKIAEDVSAVVGDRGLNLLINNAGISGMEPSFAAITPEKLVETYQVNTVAPFLLTRAFWPLLKTASKGQGGEEMSWCRAAVVNVSTLLGSISETTSSFVPGYRMSKAALNMGTKCLSIELKPDQILVVAIHPGWVKTDMGGPKAQMEKADSATSIVDTLSKLDGTKHGSYISYNGSSIPY